MEYKDERGNVIKKTPTLNPKEPIDRFEGQSKLAKILNEKFVSKMDHYTSARSTLLLLMLVYLLGFNLNWFLNYLIILHAYLMIYRFIRFWIKRWLMYMIDFCYPGNFLLLYFIIFDNTNKDIFYTVYAAASGVISLAVVVCDNQADLNNTDFLTSCFIHVLPVTTVWAIRWKHIIYPDDIFEGKTLLTVGDVPFAFDENLKKLLLYPYLLWLLWAIAYFILNTKILRKYAYSDLYESAICDFYKSDFMTCLFGDHKKYTVIKYLYQHLIFMIIVTPISLLNFYSFYFNSGYIVFIVIFLGFNQARKNRKMIQDIVNTVQEEQ